MSATTEEERINPWMDAIFCAKEMGIKEVIDEMRNHYGGVTIEQPEVEYANLPVEWWMEYDVLKGGVCG